MPLIRRRFLGATAATLAGPFVARGGVPQDAPSDGDPAIVAAIRKIREEAKLPGLVAAIVEPGKPATIGSVGIRKEGAADPFKTGDLVHLGSCTKAMTATMIATLVEEGKLAWTSTLADVFPDVKFHPGYAGATLTRLLTHRSGLPANVRWRGIGKGTTTEQRRDALNQIATRPPEYPTGSKMVYSNIGYILAGLMAETVAKASWEDLMRDRVFGPLEMKSAGYGAPGTPGKVDQPWGHTRKGGTLLPSRDDNPEAYGPAGTVHASLADWAKFAELHIRGGRGEKTPILKPETFAILQTPEKGESYAKGWGVGERAWAGGTVLMHNGSNTMWLSTIWLGPKKNVGFLAVTNYGGDGAEAANDKAIASLIGLRR